MLKQIFQSVTLAIFLSGGSLLAQSCGADLSGYHGAGIGRHINCGRSITQQDAMGLWANYCHETCFDFRRHRHGCRRLGCGAGGFDRGCFSYPGIGGDCGCDAGGNTWSGRHHGGCFGHRHHGGFFGHRHHGLGGDDCGCQSDFGQFSGGCGADFGVGHQGLGGGRFGWGGFAGRSSCESGRHQRGCGGFLSRLFHKHRHGNVYGGNAGLFATSAANCGANGAYFSEMVGHEFGTDGIQSAVSGCATPSL